MYGGARRRVVGLRREEVALLAGISTEYYTRLERGTAIGVSDSVIDGIAHALQLDEAERAHLLDLLRTAGTTRPPRRRPAAQRIRPTVQRVLDSMIGTPAFVLSGRLDILAANALGARAVLARVRRTRSGRPTTPGSSSSTRRRPSSSAPGTRSPTTPSHYSAPRSAGIPYDRRTSDLIGELSTRSEEFRLRWAAHDVRIHTTGIKLLHHPVVGDLDLPFESFPLASDPSQSLLTYTAEPGSPSARRPDPARQLVRHPTRNPEQPRRGRVHRLIPATACRCWWRWW